MNSEHEFPRIQAGDIGFDEGVGISGFIIRLGTKSPYGHCYVYHDLIEVLEDGTEVWDTVEAGPRRGVQHCVRTRKPVKVVRLWRDEWDRNGILKGSEALVGSSYGWGEICRIVARILGVKIRRWRDNPRAVICSNHVAQAAAYGKEDFSLYLRYPTNEIWPGELAVTFDAYLWDTEVA